MTRKQKKNLLRILVSALLLLPLLLWRPEGFWRFLWLLPYGIVGWDVLYKALRNLRNGQFFDENFLMGLATLGALGCGEYPEAASVMLFYQVGELFQSVAVSRSRKSIAALMDIRPDSATVEREGKPIQVDPEEVAVGETILVQPGERIPLDAVVLEGNSTLDTSALTGESLPREAGPGEEVVSGSVNLTGLLHLRVTKPYGESTVSKILELVEHSAQKKARAEHFITKFARVYTPTVVFLALALALLPPLLLHGAWRDWVFRALIFLVVSCPCALVISIPLSFFGGVGGASRQGVLVKGANYLEALASAGIGVFDKTGTLTQGHFAVSRVESRGLREETLLEIAALSELWSSHPIARSLRESCGGELDPARVKEVREISGRGVEARVDAQAVLVGSAALMEERGITPAESSAAGTTVHVAVEGRYAGWILVSDQPKENAREVLERLGRLGVRRLVMLTGDSEPAARETAQALGIQEFYAGLLPQQKVERVEALLGEKRGGETLFFVGDGINDAPVLTRADIGIAMGALGSDAAIEAADVVLMDDRLEKLPAALTLARKTLSIVCQNIVLAIGVKVLVLLLAALGMANMWMAIFADVGVSVLAILNASRMLRVQKTAG